MRWLQDTISYLSGPLPFYMHVIIVIVVLVVMAIIVVASGLLLQAMSPRFKEWMIAPSSPSIIWQRALFFASIDIVINIVLYYSGHGLSILFALLSIPASFLFFLISGYLLWGIQNNAQGR